MSDDALIAYLKRVVPTLPAIPEPVIEEIFEILRSAGTAPVDEPTSVATNGNPNPTSAVDAQALPDWLMDYSEVMEAIGVRERTVARYAERGDLVRIPLGRRNYITRASFAEYLERKRKNGTHEARKAQQAQLRRGK